MSAKNKHQTKLLTISAMLSALGVVVLAIGSVFQTLDLTTAALAAFFCIYAVIEIGGAYPWMVWGVTSFLGLLLLPQKSPAVFFLFIGCYPILKEKLERLSKALCLALKLVIFHAMAEYVAAEVFRVLVRPLESVAPFQKQQMANFYTTIGLTPFTRQHFPKHGQGIIVFPLVAAPVPEPQHHDNAGLGRHLRKGSKGGIR